MLTTRTNVCYYSCVAATNLVLAIELEAAAKDPERRQRFSGFLLSIGSTANESESEAIVGDELPRLYSPNVADFIRCPRDFRCLKQAGLEEGREQVKYAVVFEKAPNNYAAYIPDLPGCVATGRTREEVERNIREAIVLHLEGMSEDGEPIPEPQAWTALVDASPRAS
jgi:predicted RNase H-like HicB family nuclease